MAEQAINTIYGLGEHPDIMCNNLIKSLARRVFTPRERSEQAEKPIDPDAMDEDTAPEDGSAPITARAQSSSPEDKGDAFELSQLLFVVGHVAMKQIVYLELVEREWKRQKDEKEKGTLLLEVSAARTELGGYSRKSRCWWQ